MGDDVSESARPVRDGRTPRRARQPRGLKPILSWLLLALFVVALWPAVWGGITGVTIVDGQSMEPVYSSGDVVLTLRMPSYAVGDVISYQVPAGQNGAGGRVIHRIIATDDSGDKPVFTSQGDNNDSVDPWKFGTADVMGQAMLRLPGLGKVFSGSNGVMLGAAVGLGVMVLLWPSRSKKASARRSPESTDPVSEE